jgi:hypothetical protein
MPSAFVSKLAAQGARDPEALAAWIGRRKHGATAFTRLATAGRGKSAPGKAVQEKTMTRQERAQVNRTAAELWTETAFNRADAQTPQEADAKTREDVLTRRGIERARRLGVIRGDLPEWQAEQVRQSRGNRRVAPGSAEVVRPESPESRRRFESIRQQAREAMQGITRREEQERAARLRPATGQEQRDIDRAAAGLVERPELFQQLDQRLPAESDATTRQQVIQRRAVEEARKRMAARRR